MSLRFYIGPSGSGKSTGLYREIIDRSIREPERTFLVIVPDQFTMQTQMDLVCMHPRKGIMNIDVLSFGRLAHRITEETGEDGRTILDDTGKSLVLRRIAGQLRSEMKVIGGNLNRPGYIHEVKSAISEFMQYGIDEKKLEELAGYARKHGSLHYKLKDLGVLYHGFREYTREKFVTTEETMEQLARRLYASELVKGSVIAIDGFTGFTPVQNQVLRALMERAEEVIVSVTADGESVRTGGPLQATDRESGLFQLSTRTLESLTRLAAESGIPRGADVVLSTDTLPRFRHNPSMAWLERHLFRYPIRPCESESSIRIFEASTQREEVRQVCIAIREYLRATGGCFRDVAIIAGDLAAYASYLETEAAEYGIPLYLDRTRGIVLNPFIEYVKSALQILIGNFSYEKVFHYIRSGLADFEPEEADRLENYVLAVGIRGKKKWNTLFTAAAPEMEEPAAELAALNASREKLLDQLSPLMGKFQDTKALVMALYDFIQKNQVQQKLKAYETEFAGQQDAVREREYAQIYRLVMDLLNQIVELIGDEAVSVEEFYQILDAGFAEIQVGTIPQNVDRVVAGDMERTRLKQVKALFFLGVNDGYIPKNASGGGIISDLDREFLAESGTELAPTPRQQMYIQRLYLYMNMTKPSDRLYLSYARMNGEGKAMRPAYLIDMVRKLFPAVEVSRPEERPEIDQIQSMEDGCSWLVQSLRRFADGRMEAGSEEEARFGQLYRVYLTGEKDWLKKITQAAFYHYEDSPLGKAAALALFGNTLLASVSRLEQYASCAYAHFLQYGLNLRERDDYSFEAVDMGNIFHGVLEIFGDKLRECGYTWFDFPAEEGERLIEEAVESYSVSYGNTILYDTARNQYVITRLKRILKRTVQTLQYQLQKGVFQPEQFEVSFSVLEELSAVNIALTETERIRLRGRIDRVDTWETTANPDRENVSGEDLNQQDPATEAGKKQLYVKVIDYKSGSRDFSLAALYYGLQLQLVVYLNAAMEMEQKAHPNHEVLPAAMLYYRVQDPLIEPNGTAADLSELEKSQLAAEKIQKEILGNLRMTGVVNADEKVVHGLDTSFAGKSDVIPVERKKDGSYSARSAILRPEDFRTISDYVSHKVRSIGADILDGRIPLDPYTEGNTSAAKTACTYCPYIKVCGFDRKLPGYQHRPLPKLDDETALDYMRRELEP